MPDISVGNAFDSGHPKKADSRKSQYSKIEKEYIEFKKKLKKSDMANSPSAVQSELEILARMKAAALKEGLEKKIEEIEEREEKLVGNAEQEVVQAVPYYIPVNSHEKGKEIQDENIPKVLSSFSDASDEHKEYLIKKLTSDKKVPMTDSVAETMQRIGKMGCHPNTALFFFEKFAKNPDEDKLMPKVIDLAMVDKFENLKSKGIDDNDAIKVLSHFNEDYKDKEVLDQAVNKFADEKISPKRIKDIISVLSVKQDDGIFLSPVSVQHIASFKNALLRTENVEIKEQNNPIAQLNTREVETDNDIIVIKDNEIFAIYPKTENSKKNYANFIAQMQDDIMYDLAEQYTDDNGEIPFDAMRVVTSLRRSGIVMKELMPLMKFCYPDGKIESKNLAAVNRIKSAGALSSDVIKILSAINKDDDNNYDANDMENAQILTKACIDGDNVASLLPLVRDSKDTLDLSQYLSSFIEKKSNIVDLIKLTKNEDGSTSNQSIEIIANLAKNFLDTEEKSMSSIDFLLNSKSILNAAKDFQTNSISDSAAGICAVMCQNNETPENILMGLHICKNQEGKVDSSLADILWNMSLDNANINEIENLIDTCKSDTGAVKKELVHNILDLYDNGKNTKEIMDIVLNSG